MGSSSAAVIESDLKQKHPEQEGAAITVYRKVSAHVTEIFIDINTLSSIHFSWMQNSAVFTVRDCQRGDPSNYVSRHAACRG